MEALTYLFSFAVLFSVNGEHYSKEPVERLPLSACKA